MCTGAAGGTCNTSCYGDSCHWCFLPDVDLMRLLCTAGAVYCYVQYMSWVKQQIVEGRPVIAAVRVDTDTPDVW
jgi:hypothetical protein